MTPEIKIGAKITLKKPYVDRRNNVMFSKGTLVKVIKLEAENLAQVEVQVSNRKIIYVPFSYLTDTAA